MKKGDLKEIRVFKFKMAHQLTLLAYKYEENEKSLVLLALGPHENSVYIPLASHELFKS